ncbi:hypothetical protein KUF83_03780 [Streptomyces sp. BV286]|uniref:hypothetical protein n=1 Tax=Streptomyces sp. BV286 TaxID=2849672 RepID=UPI001C2DFB8A|nr:hypothetical protein [Streptomyces sp. BV286]MBV1935685.1 hypothetical protein [Streptomyces sp. BV286]
MSFQSERTPDSAPYVPFPRSRLLTPDRGSRPRNALNQLVALTAVFGIGAGGWGLWLEVSDLRDRAASRERISEACGGLVDPDKVLDLNGGTHRARAGTDTDDSFTVGSLPGACVIYRVDEPGTSYGHFVLTVYTNPSDRYANIVSGWTRDPFDERIRETDGDLTREADEAPDHPVEDAEPDEGALGHYDDNSATVKALCTTADGTGKGHATSVNVMAEGYYDDITFQDRQALIELAHDAAFKAAHELGCTAEKPVPVSFPRLYVPHPRLVDSAKARGTCRWFRDFAAREGRGRLPDRALDAPVGERSFTEKCLLAVSEKQVRSVLPGLTEDEHHGAKLRDVLRVAPWWMESASAFGDEAREVVSEDGLGDDQTPVRPGTAGHDRAAGVWWASSTCGGEPALHTLSVDYPYDEIVEQRLKALFHAYVDDITARRNCTDVKYPKPSAFRAD